MWMLCAVVCFVREFRFVLLVIERPDPSTESPLQSGSRFAWRCSLTERTCALTITRESAYSGRARVSKQMTERWTRGRVSERERERARARERVREREREREREWGRERNETLPYRSSAKQWRNIVPFDSRCSISSVIKGTPAHALFSWLTRVERVRALSPWRQVSRVCVSQVPSTSAACQLHIQPVNFVWVSFDNIHRIRRPHL